MRIVPSNAYTISGDTKVKNAGTYKLTITAKQGSGYRGSTEVTYEVKKADQNMSVTVKKAKVKSGTRKIKTKKVFKIKDAVGKVTYTKVDVSDKLSIKPNGKIKVKKGTKKGEYSMNVLVSAAGDENYMESSQTVEVVIKVK